MYALFVLMLIGIANASYYEHDKPAARATSYYYNKQYTYFNQRVMTARNARRLCDDHDGHVARLRSQAEADYVREALNIPATDTFWLGVRKSESIPDMYAVS